MTLLAVRFHPEAETEYLEAVRWYRERSPLSAVRFEAEISRSEAPFRRMAIPGCSG